MKSRISLRIDPLSSPLVSKLRVLFAEGRLSGGDFLKRSLFVRQTWKEWLRIG